MGTVWSWNSRVLTETRFRQKYKTGRGEIRPQEASRSIEVSQDPTLVVSDTASARHNAKRPSQGAFCMGQTLQLLPANIASTNS